MDAIIYFDPNLDGILTKWKKKIDEGMDIGTNEWARETTFF